MTALLSVNHLTTVFDLPGGPVPAIDDVSFEIRAGETLGLVGESGSGKSVTALSIVRLVQPPGRIAGGTIVFKDRDLLTLSERDMREVRGAEIALIFQEPMTALNPVFTVGDQIAEALLVHRRASRREAKVRAVELLIAVGVPDAANRARDYPHQLSGGMRQRVLIAAALACKPSLLIADEPTTALDVTIQAQILDLLRDMKAVFNLSLLLITHDLGIIAETADRVAVMYAGRVVEEGTVRDIFHHPQHPYTCGLLASLAEGAPGERLRTIEGTVPMLGALPPGCAFNPRCPDRFDPCTSEPPPAYFVGVDHTARCYLHDPMQRPSPIGTRPSSIDGHRSAVDARQSPVAGSPSRSDGAG
jgi:oligopeptide/dipeptide ABC transporter ATP-binding protein